METVIAGVVDGTVPVTRSHDPISRTSRGAVNSNGSFNEARQPRRGCSQSLPRTQRAKSSVPTLLRHRIVPTRCPVKRSRFNKRSEHSLAQGLLRSSRRGPISRRPPTATSFRERVSHRNALAQRGVTWPHLVSCP
jgi:hypothetical protein